MRVCNKCGFIWESMEDRAGKTCYVRGPGLCTDCHGLDTQLTTDRDRTNLDKIAERRKHHLKSLGMQEESRKTA
jgi:hypothetical protein